jgi:predicted metalloendopeptidase
MFLNKFSLFKIAGEIDNWWDSDTEASYKKKAQCMIDQYSSFTAKQV